MKKIFIIFIALFFYSTSVVAVEKFKFKYNLHENLPKKWITEFNNIMNIVQEVMPINENTNHWVKNNMTLMNMKQGYGMDIYAWKSTKNPFPEKRANMKYSGLEGINSPAPWVQLDINPNDLKSSVNKIRTYSVIVHEYFHVYQRALSHDKILDRNSPKWLFEGGAKVLEEIYLKQYYKKYLLKNDLKQSDNWSIKRVSKEPKLYEKYNTSPQKKGFDNNYSGSAFIVLALVNELKKNNISEEKAFELVFREFWIQRGKQPQGWNWQPSFQNTFGMSVPEFYERLSKYKRKDLKKILPSKTLKIQDIFS